jgi:predicted small secreted protein
MNLRRNTMALTLALLAGALMLNGCSTWTGVGKDVEHTGDAMTGKGTYITTVNATPD